MIYIERLRAHLSDYKIHRLGVDENGLWVNNKRAYPYILPQLLKKLNLIEIFRKEFWEYKAAHPEVLLHQGFHHLNSSQAMCFNLFFPFIAKPECLNIFMQKVLECTEMDNPKPTFEMVFDLKESTNFDFAILANNNRRCVFEIKFSERRFAHVQHANKYQRKFDDIYQPMLRGKIRDGRLTPELMCEHYQLLRNIAYADQNTTLFLVYPRANEGLSYTETLLHNDLLLPEIQGNVKILYLEQLIPKIRHEIRACDPLLMTHYLLFEEKYLVP